MTQDALRFENFHKEKPSINWTDIVTQLHHFSIVTYLIDPLKAQELIDSRFVPETIEVNGQKHALASVVSFIDVDFYIGLIPFLKFNFPQTNYRIYVIDSMTGERGIWFLGVTLGSHSVLIPKYFWQMPWHYADYQTEFEFKNDFYSTYSIQANSRWSNISLALKQIDKPLKMEGFQDLETARVILTHPLRGFFHRADGQVGTYSIWHDKLELCMGECLEAKIDILDQLGLVSYDRQLHPFNVLLQNQTEFIIQLPPDLYIMQRKM